MSDQITAPVPEYRPEDECDHRNLQVTEDAEGDLDEQHLTRLYTDYYCPDCGYAAETPPTGWEAPFVEPDED